MIVVADGAGGTSHGAATAQAIVDRVVANPTTTDWSAALVDLDEALCGRGQSTAVILCVTPDGITGASAGDSGAWIVRGGAVHDLTHGQVRKPLLGDGCEPFAFGGPFDGTLIVATDGLFRYAKRQDIAFVVERGDPPDAIARRLVDLVRLADGSLQDDIAVVVVTSAATL